MEPEEDTTGVVWGRAFTWAIRGASVEQVWKITGDFGGVDKWVTTLVQSCELLRGHPQQPGCVRKPLLYPASPGQPFTFGIEKLLLMDQHTHHYQYAILGGTLPGFSLMKGYVSTFKLSSLISPTSNPSTSHEYPEEEPTTVLHWSFTCDPVSTLSEQDAHNVAFSLYEAAIKDLKEHLALPDTSITLLD